MFQLILVLVLVLVLAPASARRWVGAGSIAFSFLR